MEDNNDLSEDENWKENTNIDYINESDINESDDGHVPEDCDKKRNRGSQNRFSARQTRALVENWVAAIAKLECSDSLKHWKLIQENVNKLGSPKSVDQLKKKVISLKKKYKGVKANNRKSGRSRMTCNFFEEIDSVLGTRDVVVMPAVKSSGQPVHNTTVENTPPAPVTHQSATEDATDEVGRNERPIEIQNRNTRKRTKHDAATAINNTILEMQERQDSFVESFFAKMEAMEERAHERNSELMLKLIEAMNK